MKKLLISLILFIAMDAYAGTWTIENSNIFSQVGADFKITYFYKANKDKVISKEIPITLLPTQKKLLPLPGCVQKVILQQPLFGKKIEQKIHCPLEGDKGGVIRFNRDSTLSVIPNK